MPENRRREFMKGTGAVLSGLALASCAPSGEKPLASAPSASETLDSAVLEVVGRLVLPLGALGEAGLTSVLSSFRRWLDELEPVTELDHAYIWTDDVLYGPPSPAPLWSTQLQALDLQAQKDKGTAFTALSPEDQEEILKRQLPRELPEALPDPARAPHVALGLLAYFYESSQANDLCYEAAIERHTCRGLESSSSEPSPKRS